ncbi:DUF4062 domain-containing protein [Sorangium sp. So ce426]|uniref:DUF4062 domain-containing protein n=1 Tax=Sorangium sp. So ce426 TaxID=3133312 RepID=UPI003F5AFE7D
MDETPKPTAPAVPRPIRPKYQVFVSSTFGDLENERKAVTWEILKLGEIPTGMENFSAESDRGWRIIQKTIDRSDYYVLVLAGRYGSPFDSETGVSWTEHEYDYAHEHNIPVIAFIRKDAAITGDKMDTGKTAKRLQEFKAKVKSRHLVEWWDTEADLRARVASAIPKRIREDEDEGTPRPGWYRGGQGASPAVVEEMAHLLSDNRTLREENERLKALVAAVKEVTTFEVEVLDSEGNPLPELTFKFVYQQDPQHAAGAFTPLELSSGSTSPGPADLMWSSQMVEFNQKIEKYLATAENANRVRQYTQEVALNGSTRIIFAIRSAGGPTTNDVRCEIEFPEGFTLHCGELPNPRLPHDLPERPRRSERGRGSTAVATLLEYVGAAVPRAVPPVASFFHAPSSNTVYVDGTAVTLSAKKLQHASRIVFSRSDDIVTVLTPQNQLHEGELRYRILSDETKPQEGTIPFRIVYE